MNPHDRKLWIDLTAARYFDAVERQDFEAQDELWQVAATDPELEAAFHDVHAALLAEREEAAAAVQDAAERHLVGGEVVRVAVGPVTVADVANELFRHTPDRLTAEAHALNERLRAAPEPLPADLGLSKLAAWCEARYGAAPGEYWKAFRDAALKLELRAAAEVEYQLAARVAPKSGGQQ